MVWVGLTVVLGDVRRWPKLPRVGGRLDHSPEHLGAEAIHGGALTPSPRSAGLCLSVAPSLDSVMDIMVVRRGTPRGKLLPSLLPRLGAC